MGDVILGLAWGGATLLPLLLRARHRALQHRGAIGRRAARFALAAALLLSGALLALPRNAAALPPPPPTTYTVTRVDDPAPNGCSTGDCSLREAVLAANAAPDQTEVIVALPAGQYRLTRPIAGIDTPQTGDLDLLRDVTITGAGAATTAISAGGIDRVLDIGAAAVVTINGITLRDGNARVSGIAGGGVSHDHGGAVHNHGIVTLVDTTIRDSSALASQPNGGGLYNAAGATAILRNATVALNTALTGGGIENGGDLFAVHATVTGNEGTPGGGVRTTGSGANTIVNTIIAGNRNVGTQASPDCAGPLNSPRHSLIQDPTGCTVGASPTGTITGHAPLLGYLTGTAGYVFAYEPGPTSPAVNAARPQDCLGRDQRGVARPQGPGCDIGSIELRYVTLTTAAQGAGNIAPGTGGHPEGASITLVPTPATPESVFTGWTVDGQFRGWANPLTITMGADHSVVASFAPVVPFSDVGIGQPHTQAIIELAARGHIKGYGDGTFGPDDQTLRAQMAALIARAMGYTDSPANPFTDRCDPANCVDDELWNRVGELASRNIARGYTDAPTCAPAAAPCYAPRDNVLHAQVLSFITRAMVDAGYWQQQASGADVYGGVLKGTGHEQDVATYLFYTGANGGVPDYPASGGFPAWDQPATRGWFARALWAALDSHWGVDRVP